MGNQSKPNREIIEENQLLTQKIRKLETTEFSYKMLLASAAEGILVAEVQTKHFIYANPALCSMFGYTEEDILQLGVENIHPKEYLEHVLAEFDALVKGEKKSALDIPCLRKDGSLFYADISEASMVLDGVNCQVGFFTDITGRKQAEEKLRESEKKYRRLHETTREAFASVDMDGRIQEFNPVYRSMMGYSEEELSHLTYLDLTPEKWHAFETRIIEEQVLVHGYSDLYEKEYQRKDGHVFPVEVRTVLVRDDAGNPAGMWAMLRDITDRKKMEAELKAAKDYLRTVFNNVYDAILIHDLDGTVTDVNDKMLELYRVSREEAIGLNVIQDYSLSQETMEETVSAWDKVMSGEHIFTEWKARRPKDGSLFDVEVFLTKLSLPDGDHILSNIRDISERKRTERVLEEYRHQLENTNKELESFSYSVSHDLRAPLRAIEGFSRMLIKDLEGKLSAEGKHRLNLILDNTSKMNSLIDNLLALSRITRTELTRSKVDMTALAKSAWKALVDANPETKAAISIGDLPEAMGNENLLLQVFTNLLSNAAKYTRKRRKALIEVGGGIKSNANVYYVKDNGAGFDMKYSNKLFGVFQRLHPESDYEGTGIGLAIVKRIIHRHGGRVWAEGKVGKGATFYFTLPSQVS